MARTEQGIRHAKQDSSAGQAPADISRRDFLKLSRDQAIGVGAFGVDVALERTTPFVGPIKLAWRATLGRRQAQVGTVNEQVSPTVTTEAPVISTTKPAESPKTEAPTTTTTEVPEVFRSAEGRLLKRFGYSAGAAATIMELAKNVQAKTPDEPIMADIGGADRLRLIDMPFHPAGAKATSKYIGEQVASGYTTVINFDGVGEAKFKMSPLVHASKEAVLVLPVGAAIPPEWADAFKGTTSSYGFTRHGMTVIQIDTTRPTAAYLAQALEITEGFMRKGILQVVSREGVTAQISDSDLEQIAREVRYNRDGMVGGMKATGYSVPQIEAFINGTDGKKADIINVNTWPRPLKLPSFDQSVYNGLPGSEDIAWG